MALLRYLAACAVAGVVVGRAFGEFARAAFHYPFRLDATPYWHQALLRALEVVEFPGLFALTLASSLGLWAWLRPKSSPPVQAARRSPVIFGLLAAIASLIVMPVTNRPGQALAGVAAGLMGALVAALLMAFWREASEENRSVGGRWQRQLPLAAGHLAATSAAALSLGYRGESALVHAIALLIGFGIFGVEVVLAAAIAGVASRRLDGRG